MRYSQLTIHRELVQTSGIELIDHMDQLNNSFSVGFFIEDSLKLLSFDKLLSRRTIRSLTNSFVIINEPVHHNAHILISFIISQ